MEKKRKFLSEYGVNLFTSNWIMMPADQIHSDGEFNAEEKEVAKKCHIYLVCRRPAVSFVKDSLHYSAGKLSATLSFKEAGVEMFESYKGEFELHDDAVSLSITSYPHREIQTYDANGDAVRRLPASILTAGLDKDHLLKKLEVLYVGQAFGNGSRSAHDRLKSHSTLQKILADGAYKYPDSEISVLMFQYEQYRLVLTLSGGSGGVIDDERDKNRFVSVQENPLSEKQQIGLAEAALIRYFQPEYNDIYKRKFPSPTFKLLQKCYELDFSGLIVEINTDDYLFQLFSSAREPKMHHTCNIDLISEKNRASFFYVSSGDNEVSILPGIIGAD